MRSNFLHVKIIRFLFIAGTCLLLGSCKSCVDKVKIPTTPDNTPPSGKWIIHNVSHSSNLDITVSSGGQPLIMELDPKEEILIKLEMLDPEGVRRLTITSEGHFVCLAEGTSIRQSASETIPQVTAEFPDSSDSMLPVNPFLLTTIRYEPVPACQSGFRLAGATRTLDGTGNNYSGGTVNMPRLTFKLKIR